MMTKIKCEQLQNGKLNEQQEANEWRAGYRAECDGMPFNPLASKAWQEGYKASYKEFLDSRKGGLIPQ